MIIKCYDEKKPCPHRNAEAKALKDMQKAARKFGKNIEKVRKDFEKYRDKAATEDERAFWQSILDIIPVPNEDAK